MPSEGKLYVCAVKDVCSRRIVGYAIGPRMTARLADAALRIAIARRRPTGTVVVHSDRGGQFRSRFATQADQSSTSTKPHGYFGISATAGDPTDPGAQARPPGRGR